MSLFAPRERISSRSDLKELGRLHSMLKNECGNLLFFVDFVFIVIIFLIPLLLVANDDLSYCGRPPDGVVRAGHEPPLHLGHLGASTTCHLCGPAGGGGGLSERGSSCWSRGRLPSRPPTAPGTPTGTWRTAERSHAVSCFFAHIVSFTNPMPQWHDLPHYFSRH